MRRLTLGSLFVALVLVGGPIRAADAFRFPAGKHATAELRIRETIPVLTVSGSPAEIGAAVGTLALAPARKVLDYPRGLVDLRGGGALWKTFVGAGRGMYRRFPDAYRDELESMARTAKADREMLIVGNTLFDIKKFLACSAVVVEKERSATGGPLLARNLDYPSLGYIHRYSLVTVYRPKGRLAFAAVGFPGLVGVLSGMNEAGLALGVLEVFAIRQGETHFDPKGVPYALCLRQVLEQARTIDEARKLLEGMQRTTTINVAIADRNRVGVLEISPGRVVLRPPGRGVCLCTNHYCTPALVPERRIDIDRTYERFARLKEVETWKEPVKVEDLRRQLDRVNLGTLTLQTMVFEPATLRLHLSIGTRPASAGKLRTLDLAPLLRPTGEKRR